MQFLEPPRHLDRPAVVPEVPADLAHDRRHRERHEVRTGVDVEPDDRVHQADPGDLDQIVAGLAAAVEAAGDVIGQRQASLDDAVALALELRGALGSSSANSRNMSGTSAYSELDRDDDPRDAGGSPGGTHSSRRHGDADHRHRGRRAPPRRGTSCTSSVSEVSTCQLKLPGRQDVIGGARWCDTSTTNSLTRGSITNTSVGVRRRPSGSAGCRPRRRPAEDRPPRRGRDPRRSPRHRSGCERRRGSRAVRTTRTSTDRGLRASACSALSALDMGWPPGDIEPRVPQRDCQLIIPGSVPVSSSEVMMCARIPR